MRWFHSAVVAATFGLGFAGQVLAADKVVSIPTQYIAALGSSAATSGEDAATWALWPVDPGPRGVWARDFATIAANNNIAPDGWTFEPAGWWVEEYGRIMEAPNFPLPAGRYVVTGGREVTAVLTVEEPAADGRQSWELSDGASVYDVTHLRCRAALYTPQPGQSCSPEAIPSQSFPVRPGDAMPPVPGCNKQDFQVLIVVGMVVEE
jgi:hypothetical protein